MEELVSPDVQVVLNVKEGRGFEQILQPTSIVATLNGHSLETDVIEPNSNPQYATDLVWEVDKSRLRKMRSEQVPLKLECFACKGNDSKEKLGYLILSIRSAQCAPRNKDITLRASWHRLLGLKNDIKTPKPELFLALSIRDQPCVMPNPSIQNTEIRNQAISESNELVPVLLHDEDLIQLGPLNTCQDLFLMSFTLKSASNLDLLLLKELDVNAPENLYFWCSVLKNDIYFQPFKKDHRTVWTLNDKIVLRIRTSLKILKEYVALKPHLFIYLNSKDITIGESRVDLQPLVPTDNIQEFLRISSTSIDQRCFLIKKDGAQNNAQHRKPYLDLQITLQYLGAETDVVTESSIVAPNSISKQENNFGQIGLQNVSETDCHRNPGGDFGKNMDGMNYMSKCQTEFQNTNKYSSSCECLRGEPLRMMCSQSADTVMCPCMNKDGSKNVEAYHCYYLNVSLTAIKLLRSKLTTQIIEIRFHHPKTSITATRFQNLPPVSSNEIKLENCGYKLHFISTADELKHLLEMFPPKISIHNIHRNTKLVGPCICECVLDLKQLNNHNKFECQYNAPLYDMEQNKIGNLDVMLNLEDHGPYYKIKEKSSENVGPPILDDTLAYKIVDELETWKERQKKIFQVQLKRKEERHLNLLSEEWQKHRENLESKLACSVEQCKMLANSLNNATEDLRTRRLKSLEKETRLIKANEDLQCRYEMKVQELKNSLHIVQEELTSKINVLEKRNNTLEAQIEPLSVENKKLNALLTKQSEELESLKKGSLTQDQTANLLQELKTLEEKLHNAQESKSFFKEQWAKAVREIHRMKIEHQQTIQVQIKNSKDELQNLDLEELLCTDSTALTNDQILLGQIQKEIEVIKPKSSFAEEDNYHQIFTPISTIGPKIPQNNKTISKKSEEHDERLQQLIEERDSLLKTGSYTIDDAIIVKLNAEIRSLIMR